MQDKCQIIKPLLSDKRYAHSVAVAEQAVRLARMYHVDPEKADTAAIFHDICKEMPRDQQLHWIEKSGIILDSVTQQQPNLWHGPAAVGYLGAVLHIQDPDILNAVRYHTSARAEMSTLEQIIYLADLTSKDRNYPDVDLMRQLTDQSLERAMQEALAFIVTDLVKHRRQICPDTYRAYNWYCP